jgi:Tfp pilus assembly protein PilV
MPLQIFSKVCYNELMIKKGDTLIEVTLAVGIFSMIAIAVVAVMSNGTSNAQTSLESTLAREEVDSQTEALRFIQSSAIIENDSNGKYNQLWQAITDHAITIDKASSEEGPGSEELEKYQTILQYAPQQCSDLYNNDQNNPETIFYQNAFIINPRALGNFSKDGDIEGTVLLSARKDNDRFREASTYPRLVYGGDSSLTSNQSGLNLVEGIYVIAVADSTGTKIATTGNQAESVSSFYDFYIRTCWYGSNAETPSLVSTVIRLYNPAVVINTNSN